MFRRFSALAFQRYGNLGPMLAKACFLKRDVPKLLSPTCLRLKQVIRRQFMFNETMTHRQANKLATRMHRMGNGEKLGSLWHIHLGTTWWGLREGFPGATLN
ncbi:hypothetical protein OAL01_01900 [Rubripirellula sp.]|nr:hypothetical protein [Rubripirellula sp.]